MEQDDRTRRDVCNAAVDSSSTDCSRYAECRQFADDAHCVDATMDEPALNKSRFSASHSPSAATCSADDGPISSSASCSSATSRIIVESGDHREPFLSAGEAESESSSNCQPDGLCGSTSRCSSLSSGRLGDVHTTSTGTAVNVLRCEYAAKSTCAFCTRDGSSCAYQAKTNTKMGWPLHELDDDDVIDRIADAFNDWAKEARWLVALMEDLLNGGRCASDYALPFTAGNKAKIWEVLVMDANKFNKQMLEFAQNCPGFAELPNADKVKLVKESSLAVWLITKAELFVDGETYLPLPDQTLYTRRWMTIFLPEELVETMHRYTTLQNAAGLTIRELALLCAITLMTCHEGDLLDSEAIERAKERAVQALLIEINRTRVSAAETLECIKQLLNDLVSISKQQDAIFSKSLDLS